LIEALKMLPIFGQGMWFFEFVFMKQKWEKDKENMRVHLNRAKNPDVPLWLLIFPEGTLNTPGNVEKSKNFAKKVGASAILDLKRYAETK
jgi:1-acyl-sn-glycerol-3-phosphate acyltransferase